MSHFKASAFSVGDRVVIRPTGQIGTVERTGLRSRVTGQVLVHVGVEECPWTLIQPQMSLVKHEPETE